MEKKGNQKKKKRNKDDWTVNGEGRDILDYAIK